MAYTQYQLGQEAKTTIFGSRLALDRNDSIVGPTGYRLPVEDMASSLGTTNNGTTMVPFGVTRLTSGIASSGIFTLQALPVGSVKEIYQTATSTLGYSVRMPSGVTIISSLGSSQNQLVFQGLGAAVQLRAVSSVQYSLAATLPTTVVASTF